MIDGPTTTVLVGPDDRLTIAAGGEQALASAAAGGWLKPGALCVLDFAPRPVLLGDVAEDERRRAVRHERRTEVQLVDLARDDLEPGRAEDLVGWKGRVARDRRREQGAHGLPAQLEHPRDDLERGVVHAARAVDRNDRPGRRDIRALPAGGPVSVS